MRYAIAFLFLIFAMPALSYGNVSSLDANNVNSIRAIVDDKIITQDEVLRHAAVAIREAQGRYKDDEFFYKVDEILKDTLDELINRKVLIREAQRLFGINEAAMRDVEKDLDSFLKGAVQRVGSLSKYYEIAEAQGISPIEKRNELREDIMIDRIMKEYVYDRIKIQPKALRRYYRDNIDEYREEKEVKIRHIMIRFSAHGNNREKAFSLAQQVMNRIRNGEDFAPLAERYSDGPQAQNGGLWSIEEINELRKDLRDVVFSLQDNECSDIVESPVGYHIFKMELVRPEKIQNFEDVQDDIYKRVYRDEITRLRDQYINRLRANCFIRIIR
ncbi:MAG: foldase protein PrsA [Candidatus Loosdrechtia sp.]|uniref:peptidylprolyl isomerase n=1 Tax=Candidatus Loosdrechtia sp. TaxID=3101272 RepID=UPI003A652863|nr:MAG: peptidylprolyl isomerase [Candidatus Jettenia sp. AMX2]